MTPTKKSLILYGARAPRIDVNIGYSPVVAPPNQKTSESHGCYVRAVLFDGDCDDALDAAGDFRMPGEIVLNTIPCEGAFHDADESHKRQP